MRRAESAPAKSASSISAEPPSGTLSSRPRERDAGEAEARSRLPCGIAGAFRPGASRSHEKKRPIHNHRPDTPPSHPVKPARKPPPKPSFPDRIPRPSRHRARAPPHSRPAGAADVRRRVSNPHRSGIAPARRAPSATQRLDLPQTSPSGRYRPRATPAPSGPDPPARNRRHPPRCRRPAAKPPEKAESSVSFHRIPLQPHLQFVHPRLA